MQKTRFLMVMLTLSLVSFIATNSYAEEKKTAQNKSAAAPAPASTVPTSSVANDVPFRPAVIDREAIFKQAKASKALRDQVQAKWAEYNKKFQDEQKSLVTKSQKMIEEKSKLTVDELKKKDDDFQKKQTELSQQETNLQIKAQEEKQKLNEVFNTGLKDIEKELASIVEEYAQKNKITFLAAKEMILLNEKSYDITEDILKELDKRMPTYKVKFKEN